MDMEGRGTSVDARPSEIRTFLIADVRGYTAFTLEHGDEAAARLSVQFEELASGVVLARGGRVIEVRGDEVLVVFTSARQALRAAIDLQQRIVQDAAPFGIGVGLDAGEAIPVAEGYRGAALNLAARLCSLAAAGEILASDGVIHLARKVDGVTYRKRGRMSLKGFADPVSVLEVVPEDGTAGSTRPAPHSERGGSTAFSRLLHRHRVAAELTQEELAERASVSARAVSDLERGVKTRPHRSTVELLADALELSDSDRAALIATVPSRVAARESIASRPEMPVGSFVGSLPEGRIVGREKELERIVGAMDITLRGAGRLVMLAGEPGVGKTRLAQEATVALRNRGFLTAAGRCYEPQQTMALFPARTALSALYALAPDNVRNEATDRWPYLAPMLSDDTPPIASGASDQYLLFRAVTSFINAVAETCPVAILLDDLHWSDVASIDLLLFLVRETRNDPVFLLGTYRDAEASSEQPLAHALLDLEREGLVERITVRRLAEDGTAALVADTLDEASISPEFARLIYGRTEGNPFFVRQVLRMLEEEGDIYRQEGRWNRKDISEIEVPDGVRALIGQRLTHLREDTRRILEEASVLGQTFQFDDLAAMTNRSEDDIESGLEEARTAGLAKLEEGDVYAFDHALTQRTLYDGLPPRRRRRLHLAAGEAIEDLPERKRNARVAELAWHFLQADDEERAVAYALRAGYQAEAVFAHAEAEQQYRTALELARESGDERQEAAVTTRLGRVLSTTGRYDEALALLESAVAMHRRAGRVDDEAQVLSVVGEVGAVQGPGAQVIERLRRSLEDPDRGVSTSTRAALLIALAQLYLATGQYVAATGISEQASALAREAGDTALRVQAERSKLQCLLKIGPDREQYAGLEEHRALEELLALAESIGDFRVACQVLNTLGDSYLALCDREKSTQCRTRAMEIALRMADPSVIAFMCFKLGWTAFEVGDWPRARAILEEAVANGRTSAPSRRDAYPAFGLGLLFTATGEWERATAVLVECIDTSRRMADLQILRHAQWVAADQDLLAGRPDLARDRLEPLLDRSEVDETDVTLFLPYLAQAYLDLGDMPRALATAREAVQRAKAQNEPSALADAPRVLGMVLAEDSQWDAAIETLEESASTACSQMCPYLEGRARYELGRLYHRKGDSKAARESLEQALAIFQRLGAQPCLEQTAKALETVA